MFKSLLYYKYKSILILLSTTTAITSIFLITAISSGVIVMYSNIIQTNNDLIITQKGIADTFFSDVDRKLISKINIISGVKDTSAMIVGASSISTIPIAGIYGVTYNKIKQYKLASGRYIDNMQEVMIGKNINTILNKPKTIKLFNETFNVVGVFNSKIGFENGGVIIDIKKASQMFKKSSSFLLVSLKNIQNSAIIIDKIKKLSYKIDVKTTDEFIQNYNQFKIIKTSSNAISSISFLMGFLSIISLMSIMINDRKYEFGIKRAIGISKAKIIKEIIIEVISLNIISFILSLLLSYTILEFIKHIDKFQGYLNGNLDINLIINIFISSLLMSIIGAIIPALMASKTDPIILINQGS